MNQVIKETIKYMWRSEKNRLFMAITTALVIVYSLFVLPNVSGENEVDIEMMEREMAGNVVQFETSLDDGLIVPSSLTGTTAYFELRREAVAQRELLTALKHGDVERYISIPYRPNDRSEVVDDGLTQLVFNLFGYEKEQPHQAQKNKVYTQAVENLSFHTVHDRTSLQQMHLFFIGFGPIILLIGLIFLISDIHVKDRSLLTQKVGHPLKWQKYLWVQAMTALFFVTLFYLGLGLLFYLLNGLLHGFGSFDLPIGYFNANFQSGVMNIDNFQVKTIGWFALSALPYLLLLGYLFTRLNTLFSLGTKQSVVTMVLGIFVVLFQFIYYGSEARELLGINISYFPQTYFNFGDILTGRFELAITQEIPTLFMRGILVLFITIIIVELLIYVASKNITRQKFVS
jgi:hypothetical protein